ncbi:MAG: 3-oxoacyl-ACP reductase FabG [Nitrospinae bacterium]|nr:3-oxoacyl-ACP reductase FabG [Nitrospinota bacterium]
MPTDLTGKTCIVTGASRGIGRGCAVSLGSEGCRVAVNYRERTDEAEETRRLIEEAGGEAFIIKADVSDAQDVRRLVDETRERFGPVSILINNAGIAITKPVDELTEADWDATLTVNLKSAFLLTQVVLPDMKQARWGRIVNISSNAAFTGGRVGPHYAASKAGMHGLTHAYAAALVKEGITMNSVAPAIIDTDMTTQDLRAATPNNPMERFGTVEETVDAVMLMIRNAYVTGQTLLVNGGNYFH